MGGFHGGHSGGGGGFHGGHGGGYHGGGYHGGHHTHVHISRGYGGGGSNLTPAKARIIGIILIIFGLIGFALCVQIPAKATVTDAYIAHDYTDYEKYTFSYDYLGKSYSGYGDDDIAVDSDGNKVMPIKVGDVYTIYHGALLPFNYGFDGYANVGAVFFLLFFGFCGVVMLVPSFKKKKTPDEETIDTSNQVDPETIDVKPNAKVNSKCSYCGSRVGANDTVCPACGSRIVE